MIFKQEQKDILDNENSVQAYVWERRKGATTTCILYALKYLHNPNETIYYFSGKSDENLIKLWLLDYNTGIKCQGRVFTLPETGSQLYLIAGSQPNLDRLRGMPYPTRLIFDNVAFSWPGDINEIFLFLGQATSCLAFQNPEDLESKKYWWFYLVRNHNNRFEKIMKNLLTCSSPVLRKYAKKWLKN